MLIKNLWPFRPKKTQKNEVTVVSSMEKVYVSVGQLVIGMYVVDLDRPWLGTPFLFQGFEIKTKAEIKALRELCQFVYIDMSRSRSRTIIAETDENDKKSVYQRTITGSSNGLPPPKKLATFEKQIIHAEKTYADTKGLVADFMQRAAKGGSIDGWLAKQAVAECVNNVLQTPDTMLWLSQLKNNNQYSAQHSLNVCVLSIVFGRHINLPDEQIKSLGLCGMLFDLGMMQVPSTVINKAGKLEEDELLLMQSHTTLGYELLKASGHMTQNTIETALSHHERLDGKGYPRQLHSSAIPIFTKMVTIVDTYDAITSNRIYQKGKTHLEATHMLNSMAGTHLDRKLVSQFIESLGVYPPGSLVIMTNGALAIVVEVNEEMKLRPKVIIIMDEEKNLVPEKVIDLSKMVTDKRGEVYTIKNIIRAEDWNIDSSKYYNKDILQKCFTLNKKGWR